MEKRKKKIIDAFEISAYREILRVSSLLKGLTNKINKQYHKKFCHLIRRVDAVEKLESKRPGERSPRGSIKIPYWNGLPKLDQVAQDRSTKRENLVNWVLQKCTKTVKSGNNKLLIILLIRNDVLLILNQMGFASLDWSIS